MTLKGSAAAVIQSVVGVKMVRVLRWQAGSQRLLRWGYVPSWLRAPNLVDWEIATGLVVADFVACCHRIRTCCHHLFRTARQLPNHAHRTVGTSKHWTKFTSEIDCTQNLDQGRPVSKQKKNKNGGRKTLLLSSNHLTAHSFRRPLHLTSSLAHTLPFAHGSVSVILQ